jgi:hypothetical protein
VGVLKENAPCPLSHVRGGRIELDTVGQHRHSLVQKDNALFGDADCSHGFLTIVFELPSRN